MTTATTPPSRRFRRDPDANEIEPRFLTAAELAARWGVSKQHVYNLLHKGLPSVTLGGRVRRFRTDQVDAWIEAKQAA